MKFLKNKKILLGFLAVVLAAACAVGVAAGPEKLPKFEYGQINTVLGPISADELGPTLMHEHIAWSYPGWYADESVAPYDRAEIKKVARKVLRDVKAVGIQTVVDAGTNDTGGRDPYLLRELAKKSGVNIICSTGLYYEHGGAPGYWTFRQGFGYKIEDEICELFVKEITEGIGKSNVRAGVIKIGSSLGEITAYEQAVFKAAAKAQQKTGVPIITHTEGPTMGPEQADLLISLGVKPEKIMIGHMNNSNDIDYHREILKRGVYIAFDRTGIGLRSDTEKMVGIIADLCKEGYTNRICLSHDSIAVWLGRPVDWGPWQPYIEDWYPTFVSEVVVELLKDEELTDDDIHMMMVENPKRLFSGK